MIAPGREYHELARNALDGETLVSLAVADGSIVIRSHSHLYRITAG